MATSRTNRATAVSLVPRASDISLIATRSPVVLCLPRNTVPMAPEPSSFSITYGPSSLPRSMAHFRNQSANGDESQNIGSEFDRNEVSRRGRVIAPQRVFRRWRRCPGSSPWPFSGRCQFFAIRSVRIDAFGDQFLDVQHANGLPATLERSVFGSDTDVRKCPRPDLFGVDSPLHFTSASVPRRGRSR